MQAFLNAHAPVQTLLPFVHITRAYSFDEMLVTERLEPVKGDDNFEEPLIYLFYGRPAYRAKRGNNARLEFEWPVVLLFDPEKIQNVLRIYPFDTGAFFLKFYEEFFDPLAKVDDFALNPSLAGISQFVGAFYTGNKEYFDGGSRKNVQIETRQFEAQGLLELARLPGVQGAKSSRRERDERSSAIEVQVSKAIPFRDTLLGVVLPEPYLDDDEIKKALAYWGVKEIETYGTLHNTSGDVWVGQVYQTVRKLYERLKLFK
ncbi:hypothetical protein [Bradyrhizobium sp. USDA 4452]